MNWFRSNIRLGSQIALFALAAQILLSFGHFHGGSTSADAKRWKLHDTEVFAAAQPDASDQASPAKAHAPNVLGPVRLQTSSGHAPLGHSGEDCAICAVMALANTLLDAAPPLLVSPQSTAFSYRSVATRFAEPDQVRVAFQPRAPPLA